MIDFHFTTWIKFLPILFAFSFSPSFAQIFRFHNYTMKEGLISDNIRVISQDSLGFIWIGTGEGVSVFNSREFKNYTQSDGLSSEDISCISANNKSVCIGTNGGGIDLFTNESFKSYAGNLPGKMKNINSICTGKNNTFWCGTDSGFFALRKDSVFYFHNILSKEPIYSIIPFNDDILISSRNGIYIFNEKQNECKLLIIPPEKNLFFTKLYYKNGGNIWAGTNDGIVLIFNAIKFNELKRFNLRGFVRDITKDDYGNIWVGTSSKLYKISSDYLTSNYFETISVDNGLLQNNISALLNDAEGILWIGTNTNGFSKLVFQNLIKFEIDEKTSEKSWSYVVSDKNNHFWIGLANGILEVWKNQYQEWRKKVYQNKNFSTDNIPSLCVSRNNDLFVSYPDGKIYQFRINCPDPILPSDLFLKKKIDLSKKIKFFSIFKIFTDCEGYLWCSALDYGMVVLDKNNYDKIIKVYKDKDGIPDNSIREIYQDREKNIWLGGYAHGLSEFSYGKFLNDIHRNKKNAESWSKFFSTKNGLPGNHVRAIVEDRNGNILVGTRYAGIAVINNKGIKIINRLKGLVSNAIWSITSSNSGIWLGTQSGVQNLKSLSSSNFGVFEEIPFEPFYSVSAAGNGSICFVSPYEIFIFEPNMEIKENHPARIYLNQVLVNGGEKKFDKELILPYDQNNITFQFSEINNHEWHNRKFEYRLLGAKTGWTKLVNKRNVNYASLGPGKYTFQVVALNGDSLRSLPAEVHFVIESPFYEKWWFISSAAILIISLLYFIVRMRVQRLFEVEKIRSRIAADLHDEIGSGLTKISILSEHALQNEELSTSKSESPENIPQKTGRTFERVGKISRELIDSISDVIWSIDPKYDSLTDFLLYFQNYANEICEPKKINLIVESINCGNTKINAYIRRNLQLISKEALNNSIKHSGCSEFKFRMKVRNKVILLDIKDNGKGFNPDETKDGRGILNIKKNVHDLNGEVKINSEKQGGTAINISIPIKNKLFK